MTEQSITLAVKNMTCGGCVNAVTRVIQRLDPAARVDVDLPGGKATVTTAKAAQDLANALTSAGYPANPQ